MVKELKKLLRFNLVKNTRLSYQTIDLVTFSKNINLKLKEIKLKAYTNYITKKKDMTL